MTEQEIKVNLDMLANHQAQVEYLRLEKQRLINEAVPAEIKQRLEEIEAEFAGKTEIAQSTINALTDVIRTAIVIYGATVKSEFYQAVYVKGRESWDGKSLKAYAVAHPEILAFMTTGQPSVSFRTVK